MEFINTSLNANVAMLRLNLPSTHITYSSILLKLYTAHRGMGHSMYSVIRVHQYGGTVGP